MKSPSFRHFVEQEMGQLPYFLIYGVLELTLMAILFLDGALAYLATVFADLFELVPPCLLCTRINPLFNRTDHDSHYNTTLCESHKKEISFFAYCQMHCKLSDLRTMCEACLLAFTSDANANTSNSIDCLFNDDLRPRLCSCCGEMIKAKSSSYQKSVGFTSNVPMWIAQTPCSSPSTAFTPWKNEESKLVELKPPKPNPCPSPPDDDPDTENEDAIPPMLQECEEMADLTMTPSFSRGGSRLFTMLSGESTTASPRFAPRTPRKYAGELIPFDLFESVGVNEAEDSIVNRLKKQMKQDRKSLIALSQELDEERSASAVAANNAMAMITRLQADKASVQMEALQYQRMMDEQSEYDQEALSALHELLEKREYEMLDMQDELELYRERYGVFKDVVRRSENFDKSQSFSSFTERSDHDDNDDDEDDDGDDDDDGHVSPDESVFDIETDVDPDPSINYYDQAFAVYENEQLKEKEELVKNDDQYTITENDRGGEEDDDEEMERTVNENSVLIESEQQKTTIENDSNEEA
ncbi:hypothetical protein V2J09_011567 [Rumex salicifolius]